MRQETRSRLEEVLGRAGTGHQQLAERDVAAGELAGRLARLDAVENGLCFGRIDLRDGAVRHIGRIGILDDGAGPGDGRAGARSGAPTDDEPLQIDWRTPAARPFYTATAVSPQNLRRRRHISSRGRTVTAVRDEEFDGAADVAGDTALLDALTAPRSGRMSDIVATIQAEQDAVIRSPHTGVLVVQGGPGTGKTAVALHRAAYLLYTQRERLARSVVLVVGPTPTFLRYVEEVLPSLGETGVLLATVDELYPGVRARRPETPRVAEIKGRPAMAEVVAAAVRDRQHVPSEPVEIEHENVVLTLDPAEISRARDRARAARLPHNEAQPIVHRLLVDVLTPRLAERYGTDVFDGGLLVGAEEFEELREELRGSPAVREAVERLWPALTPERLLAELLASPARLAAAAPGLTEEERAALLRPADASGWSAADVPLLDEAAELLGTEPRRARAAREAAAADHAERLALAQEALDVAYGSRTTDVDEDGEDAELLSAHDVLDAELLAERHREADHRTPAERAAADRTWAFGHVVVDEAQELSGMAWRLLARRCPARSMTVVGDIAQTSHVAGADSWEQVLAPHVGNRWRLAELTVNYRLPSEIAELAETVLRAVDPARGGKAPRAVRSCGTPPWRRSVPRERLAAEAAREALRAAAAFPRGRVGVIAPDVLREALVREVEAAGGTPEGAAGTGHRVAVLDPRSAKGLEFDAVVVVDPDAVVAGSPRGLNDLYVALTRPTQRLGVLHTGEPPALLRHLRAPRPGAPGATDRA
ncbi:HelD family protein [Streptomyces sp. 4N509B]|uniref:HelD family protein n=1 Tax=Streptomyces sp. 4N509B TaxID=3457413 RepID=UPI003FCEF694